MPGRCRAAAVPRAAVTPVRLLTRTRRRGQRGGAGRVGGRCYDRATVDGMATHYQTGRKIPEELWGKVRRPAAASGLVPADVQC